MAETGFSAFNTTVDKTNRILREIEQAYDWPKERRHQSYGALRAVLHQLRDRLTIEECSQLGAQLPLLVRGIYYEGWNPSAVPVKMHKDEFLAGVKREFPFDIEGSTEQMVQNVLRALLRHVSPGEWEKIKATVPKDLSAMFSVPA